jgi:hypothetical protein
MVTDLPRIAADSTPTPSPGEPDAASRCEPAFKTLVEVITGSLVVTNGRLTDAVIVKSADFDDVYFVAGDIEGLGMPGREVGVWVTRDPLVRTHQLLYSVNGVASAVSPWPSGGQARPPFSMSSERAAEA